MIVITVNFTSVEVSRYVRDEPITLKIFFNDGSQERFIEKRTNLENIEEFTQQVITEARKMEKDINAKHSSGFLDDVVMVRFGDDEEKVEEKLHNVFRKIKDEIKKLKTPTAAQNYLQRIAMFQKSKFNI